MRTLAIGTRVERVMGIRLEGVVIGHFPWQESTDGAYRAPKSDEVPVAWCDGTKGYMARRFLIVTVE